jgi:hypothetical protein
MIIFIKQIMMNQLLFSTFFTLFFTIATGKPVPAKIADIAIPAGFKKLMEAKGDLDKDGIAELVVVFDTPKKVELGTERQLWIYKQNGLVWKLWHKCIGPVLSSEHGGMMGDPFVSVEIKHGCIEIYHFGGDADKWQYTHRYRYQNNNWYLIGAKIIFGRLCLQLSNYDYNLSTGKIEVIINTQKCDDNNEKVLSSKDEHFTLIRKPAKPILMDGIDIGENEVKLPGNHESFYF